MKCIFNAFVVFKLHLKYIFLLISYLFEVIIFGFRYHFHVSKNENVYFLLLSYIKSLQILL